MTKEEFWKKFKDGALYIHTPTEEQCMKFVQMSKENGIYLGLDMAEYFEYGENTYLGIMKKDDLDIVSRVIVEIRMGKDIDSWLAYGETEDISDYPTVEFSEVFCKEGEENESELNVDAILLTGLSTAIAVLIEGGIPEFLINKAVKEGIEHAKKSDQRSS